ncbi:TRAP transporter small permease [Caproiciproducens sp. NJN-50]|uniref:TRAP transporter small permease n=1 Tax=Caproiciproducens sp. NJN-50 TaxID=2507162 RepID=UPI0013E8DE71|nr:TRAP transporter small permease [Caproiciproducens sp. NJN-50]
MVRFFKGLRTFETSVTVITMMAFTVVGFLQVFFRVFLKSPISWSEELCRYLFIWSTMLGAVLVSANDEHFKVDMLVNLFPERIRSASRYFSYLLVTVFSVVLIFFGIKLMIVNHIRVSAALGINMSYVYLILPLNGALVILHVLESIYLELTKKRKEVVSC